MTSEAQETPSGIKRLEKRKGRFWGFLRRGAPGVVTPLSPIKMTRRLRNLMMYSIKTMGTFLRNKMGERGLTSLFEHQAEEFASSWKKPIYGAEKLARDTIMYNFQPLGIEAVYSGDAEVAEIVVEECPLPQRFMRELEFLEEFMFEEESLLSSSAFAGDTLTAKGEWPPKKVESCSVCRVVMPRIGEKLGFEWEIGMTKAIPRRCLFTIRVSPKK